MRFTGLRPERGHTLDIGWKSSRMNTYANIGGGVGTHIDAPLGFLESEKHNLGMGSDAQRRAPRAGAPIG